MAPLIGGDWCSQWAVLHEMKGGQYCEFHHGDYYETVSGLWEAARAATEARTAEALATQRDANPPGSLTLVFSVLAVDVESLYVYDVKRKELRETQSLALRTLSARSRGFRTIDVVTRAGFSEWIDRFTQTGARLKDALQKSVKSVRLDAASQFSEHQTAQAQLP
jgi:hypothetical protein